MIRHLHKSSSSKQLKVNDNEKGLTLLEVLVAFLILSLVLVTLLGRFTQAGRLNADTFRYNQALSLAQSEIEEIKKMSFDNIDSVASTSVSLIAYPQYTGMTYAVTVAESGLNTKTVTVTVTYSDEGVVKQLELTAEVARR